MLQVAFPVMFLCSVDYLWSNHKANNEYSMLKIAKLLLCLWFCTRLQIRSKKFLNMSVDSLTGADITVVARGLCYFGEGEPSLLFKTSL